MTSKVYTGCPISYLIVNGSKLRFSGLIGKFKKIEHFVKLNKTYVKKFLQKGKWDALYINEMESDPSLYV